MVIRASCAGAITDDLYEPEEHVARRRLGMGYRWRRSYWKEAPVVDLLTKLREFRLSKNPDYKIRVEDPYIQIYAETEDSLKQFAADYLANYTHFIEIATGPADDATAELLREGAIIRRRATQYRYKVIFRDGRYSRECRNAVLNYLANLGPEMANVPDHTAKMFSENSPWIWNCYCHVNDNGVLDFLRLIEPGLILNCNELVVIPTK
jgi:hypothetical protein